MTEKTELLLQQLADKLGVTIDHLWTVMINQAKYDVLISSIQMLFMIAFIWTTIKLHLRFCKEPKEGYSIYSEYDEAAWLPMMFAGITSMILLIFFLNGFNDFITAIFNPEYWALTRIIHTH